MATEVEDLIAKQSAANLNLASINDRTEIFDAVLVESKKANVFAEESMDAVVSNSTALVPFSGGSSDAFTPEVLPALSSPMEMLLDLVVGQDKSIMLLDQINGGISQLVGSSDISDLEAGGLGIDRQNGSPAGADDAMSDIASGFAPILGKMASVAGPLLLAAGIAAFGKGMFDVFTDDKRIKDITSKAREDLTAAEETFAAFAGGLEVLSFGFLDAKSTFEVVQPLADMFQKGVDSLFDPDTGLFGDFVQSFFKILDGDFFGGTKDLFTAVKTFPSQLIGFLVSGLKSGISAAVDFFAPEDMAPLIQKGLDEGFDPIIKLFSEDIPTFITSFLTNAFNILENNIDTAIALFSGDIGIGEAFFKIVDGVKKGVTSFFRTAVETIESVMTSFLTPEELSKVFDVANEIGDMVDTIANFISTMASSVRNYIGESLETLVSKLPDFLQSDTLSSIVSSIKGGEAKVTPRTKGANRAILEPASGLGIPTAKSPQIEASRTTALSKKRFDEQQVNVNVTAPPAVVIQSDPKDKPILIRKKTHDDLSLAMSGMGAI